MIYSVIIVNVLQIILEASFSSGSGSAAAVAIDRVYVEEDNAQMVMISSHR